MDIKPEHIQRRYNQMVTNGIGFRTIQVTHCVLHQAFDQAVKLGMLPRNPTDATKPPKLKPVEMKFLDHTQAQQLLIKTLGQAESVYGSQVNGIEFRTVITFNLRPQLNIIRCLFNLRFHRSYLEVPQ